MTAFYPLVLDGSQIEELQAGDTINATVANATNAINISGGAAGSVPYQTGATATTFLALGTSTHILTAGASAPQYTDPSTITVGTATNATNATNSTNATNATNTGITDDTTTNASMYLTWVTATSGNLSQKVASTKLTFNPSSGVLTCTGGVTGGTF